MSMYEKYGKNDLKKHKISPDAIAQLAIQVGVLCRIVFLKEFFFFLLFFFNIYLFILFFFIKIIAWSLQTSPKNCAYL